MRLAPLDVAAEAVDVRGADGADVVDEAAVGKRDNKPPNIEDPLSDAVVEALFPPALDELPGPKNEPEDGEVTASPPEPELDSVLDTISVSYSGLSRVPINVR